MKKTNIIYWILTGLFAAFMAFTAIPNILIAPESVDLISKQLGFPNYMVPFLGIAKLLGVIAILVPGFPRIKEWAYAGLAYDLLGASFSILIALPFDPGFYFMILPFGLGIGSYIYHHKRLTLKN